ncbi:MAG: hypothetical protein K0Q91_311 [Fibrobacteria bacterium]|jgi:hypothetical protein|nr:hypothetical protein [Fibrobacteria bacterium]
MKYLVFVEDAASRKQIEDLLTSTSQSFDSLSLADMLVKGKADGYGGIVTEHETWQRSASVLRYFETLDALNQKPVLVFSKLKKQGGIKLRRTKAFTGSSPLPAQAKDVQSLLQQMA